MNAGSGNPYVSLSSGNQLGRIDIAVAPSNANYIYAQVQSIAPNDNGGGEMDRSGCVNKTGCQLGAWATTDGGESWSYMEGSQGGALRDCANHAGDYPQTKIFKTGAFGVQDGCCDCLLRSWGHSYFRFSGGNQGWE